MATEFAQRDYAHSEGTVAKAIEEQTAKLPSDLFLWMAVGSISASAALQMFGLYNKLVKQLGSDRTENAV